jgi:hypothetical protein
LLRLTGYGHDLAVQAAYLLLRYCAEPKVAHLLRAAPPAWILGAAQAHDAAILRGANNLLGPGDLLDLDRGPAGGLDWGMLHGQLGKDDGWRESARLARAQC